MCDEWMPHIRLDMTPDQFRQLPRNAAYRYEFLDGKAFLSPRPRHYHAVLDLAAVDESRRLPTLSSSFNLRPVRAADFVDLETLFASVFASVQPFGSLDEPTRREAARQCLEKTRTGGDGPWVEQASFVADHDERPVGAALITLLPVGDPCDWDSYYWTEPPPEDCVAMRRGRPHLTWIFVSPWLVAHGIGTRLLGEAASALRQLGYSELFSTFLLGNDSSMLWHWRRGFRLLPLPDRGWARRPPTRPIAP